MTGGCGFIGRNIAELLLKRGFDVYIIDNLFLGQRENIFTLQVKYKNRIKFVYGDVTDPIVMSEITKKVDYIIHMAAVSSAPMFNEDPRRGIYVNIYGFNNILELARRFKLKKVIYASTSSLYSGLDPPHKEDMPVIPKTFYEYSMFAREHLSRIYYEFYGLKSIGLRFFSIYGPYEQHKLQYANVVTQFLWMVLKGDKPIIYGDGTQTRDFTFVGDVAKVVVEALESDIECEILNVGTGIELSFNDVIKVLKEVLEKDFEVKYVENPIKKYVYRTRADTTKLKRMLGFVPKTNLREGIEHIYRFYSKIIDRIPEYWRRDSRIT